ncbi:hypothetical protein OIE75_39790 [Streptomyces sp. NBC_01723]|uniref:hypothetical protein n=1 Tax=unclassified Streptomyces TaxID=2593676 RepID=UPI002E30FE1A|nr:hypothetical protein [Streptomyces sp. NBC_01723]
MPNELTAPGGGTHTAVCRPSCPKAATASGPYWSASSSGLCTTTVRFSRAARAVGRVASIE